ncbi:mucosal addressin cell adhesion molecule 1 [Tupaia chinensis]|uniref:mucosal addressin cell adhesion molecule 1 n=1 Tax=Tupaia chinensis TaxID=246437 RepID=UPI000FFB557B|nr:mucosal addressin cell adhesion molecule 1 [Tupaia chinensis]
MSMEKGLTLLLGLALGLLPPGCGQPLQLEPPGPVVAVALGESRQLSCRLACAPRAASVQWRGLDTSLGTVLPGVDSSVMVVPNASLSATGTRVCVGSCGDLTFQQTVQLLVYAFPDQLTVSPVVLVPEQEQEVTCTAHNVTPTSQDTLSFSLLLGDLELEGAQALAPEVREEPQEGDDTLFHVTQRWLLPPLGTHLPPALHCQVTMRLPGLLLSHRRAIPVLHRQVSSEPPSATSQEPPDATSQEPPDATSHRGSTHDPRSPGCSRTCHPGTHAAGPTERGVALESTSSPELAGPPALWAGSLVLALLLLVAVTYRLWKRCRLPGRGPTHPPGPC